MDRSKLSTAAVFTVGSILGLMIGLIHVDSPFGDDTGQFCVLLWLVSSAVLGFARPAYPWLWAVAIGPWLSVTHLVLRILGYSSHGVPGTYRTIVILFPVSVAVCSVGALSGAFLRRSLALRERPGAGR